MPRLVYKARTVGDVVIEGHIRARDERSARVKLVEKGLDVISLSPAVKGNLKPDQEAEAKDIDLDHVVRRLFIFERRISKADIHNFTGQIALLLESGTPLAESLLSLAEQNEGKKLGAVLMQIHSNIQAGATLTESMEEHVQIFGRAYIASINAAETSGILAEVFSQLEKDLGKSLDLLTKLRNGMVYPAILMTLAVFAVLFLVYYVMPKFVAIFQSHQAILPLPTRVLMRITQFSTSYWYILLAVAIAGIVGVLMFLRSPAGRRIFDSAILRVPLIGALVQDLQSTVILRTMSSLLGAGVTLTQGLEVTQKVCTNSLYRKKLNDIHNSVLQGERFSKQFCATDLFSPAVRRMVSTGEETGTMAIVMSKMATYLDRQIDKRLTRLTTAFEPLIIIFMGSAIGFVAISLMLPLFRMSSVIASGG